MAKRKTAVADGTESPPSDTPADTTTVVEQPEKADTPPEPVNGTRPVESFSVPCGGGAYIQASIWGKQIEYEGKPLTVYSVTVRKCYKDSTTGEWKNMHSFRGSELYCVQHVLNCAGNWILAAHHHVVRRSLLR